MAKCKSNKPKYTCGDRRSNARCVVYDLDIPEYSNLFEEECVTLEETTEDLYHLISYIKESIDLENFNPQCLNISKVKDTYKSSNSDRFLLKDVVENLEKKVCELENSDSTDDSLELDFKCLTSVCGEPISSLKDLLQTLINEVCNLKNNNNG